MRPIVLIILLWLGGPAMAQNIVPDVQEDVAQGQALYAYYCATCHGSDGTGNGPMSPSLVVAPTNLTTLSRRNNGVFPITRAVMRIDGRDPLVSHGSMMPVYGDFFAGTDVMTKTEAGQPLLTSQPIVDLLGYLQSIQQD
ncbi:MAG: c-type cytochrome [Yoonia sp.]|uniref:c-type cytochrome n=1 Tax=Yoonia sp. TaxID=2212373 RepID=UPI003EF66E5C